PLPRTLYMCVFFIYTPRAPRDLHSFPTRRSSDLATSPHCCLEYVDETLDARLLHSPPARRRCLPGLRPERRCPGCRGSGALAEGDRKSTRLNSSHVKISYAVFCLKKKIHYTPTLA